MVVVHLLNGNMEAMTIVLKDANKSIKTVKEIVVLQVEAALLQLRFMEIMTIQLFLICEGFVIIGWTKEKMEKKFIRWYYQKGPILASWIDNSKTRKLLAFSFIVKPLHFIIKLFRAT